MAAQRTAAGAAAQGDEILARVLVTRGIGEMSYDPSKSPHPSLVVIVKPLVPLPASAYERGVAVSLVSVVRNHPASVDPRIKSNNLLNNVLAMQEALRRGPFFEAILRNFRGELSECSQSNLFLVKDGTVRTPALDAGLLAGITREFVEEVAVEAGIPMVDAVLRRRRSVRRRRGVPDEHLEGDRPDRPRRRPGDRRRPSRARSPCACSTPTAARPGPSPAAASPSRRALRKLPSAGTRTSGCGRRTGCRSAPRSARTCSA